MTGTVIASRGAIRHIEAGYGWLAIVAIANTALSVAYYARIFGPMYVGRAADCLPVMSSRAAARAVALAVAGLVIGEVFAQAAFGPLASARLLPGR